MQPHAVNLEPAPVSPLDSDSRNRLRVVDLDAAPARGSVVRIQAEPAPEAWHDGANRAAAERHLERLEAALAAGRRRRAERECTRFLDVVHRDRIEQVTVIALRQWLPLERVGTGPVFWEPGLHRDLNRTWRVFPVRESDAALPGPAERAKAAWDAYGPLFDAHYRAYEIADGADVLNGEISPCLIGAISRDGVSADWFVLDRWTI